LAVELIASNFKAKKLEATIIWEPHVHRQAEAGHALYVAHDDIKGQPRCAFK
jgi:hypothetical protein